MAQEFYDNNWITGNSIAQPTFFKIARLRQPDILMPVDTSSYAYYTGRQMYSVDQQSIMKQVNCRNCGALAVGECEYCGTVVGFVKYNSMYNAAKMQMGLVKLSPTPVIKQVNCPNCEALAIGQCEYCGTIAS